VVPEAHWDGVLVGLLELVDFWLGAGRVGEEEGLLLEIHV
jgi:spore maturation protein SpmA